MMYETVALSVSELNEYARRLLAGDPLLRDVEVTGEISGYKHHYSGHRYFSLKDAAARVQCVMFRQNSGGLDFEPVDGMKVTVRGSASVFVRDGSFQLYVNSMRKLEQKGALYAQFEALKKKLSAEGLFDPARKREIPYAPRTIGVATSETGRAIGDIIRVARRRNPNVGIILAPCAVQGEAAVGEIVRSIDRLNRCGECDVLLVGRGGGSIEELWAFNEEPVARAIAASHVPVISCVGHEYDVTIADLVADVRAATPSAAAELAVPQLADLRMNVDLMLNRLRRALSGGQQLRRMRLEKLCAASALRRPSEIMIAPRRLALERLSERADKTLPLTMDRARTRLRHAEASLRALDPEAVLDRGYAIVEGAGGIVDGVSRVRVGEGVSIRLADGRLGANITSIESKGGSDE